MSINEKYNVRFEKIQIKPKYYIHSWPNINNSLDH